MTHLTGVFESVRSFAADIYEPDNTIGIIGLLVITLPAIIAAVGTVAMIVLNARTSRRQRETSKTVSVIRDQVQNGHTEPLRADIDRITATLTAQNETLAAQFRAISGLSKDLAEEADRRRENIGDLRNDIRRKFDGSSG